jgi:hypothetical protein
MPEDIIGHQMSHTVNMPNTTLTNLRDIGTSSWLELKIVNATLMTIALSNWSKTLTTSWVDLHDDQNRVDDAHT